jgi:hypothetical protein
VCTALALDAVVDGAQQLELVGPPDQRRLTKAGAPRPLLGQRPGRLPCRHRSRLALQRQRLQLLVLDRLVGRAERTLPDRHAARLGCRLQARGDVDGVADDRVAVADRAGDDLARVDADTQREVHTVGGAKALVDLGHRVLHAESGAHGALGVVLVRDRCTEDRHHVVADVLVDASSKTVHLLPQPAQAAVYQALDGLRVHALRDRRVAGEVGEDDRYLAPLLREGRGRRGSLGRRGLGRGGSSIRREREAAIHAKACLAWSRCPAVGTGPC